MICDLVEGLRDGHPLAPPVIMYSVGEAGGVICTGLPNPCSDLVSSVRVFVLLRRLDARGGEWDSPDRDQDDVQAGLDIRSSWRDRCIPICSSVASFSLLLALLRLHSSLLPQPSICSASSPPPPSNSPSESTTTTRPSSLLITNTPHGPGTLTLTTPFLLS